MIFAVYPTNIGYGDSPENVILLDIPASTADWRKIYDPGADQMLWPDPATAERRDDITFHSIWDGTNFVTPPAPPAPSLADENDSNYTEATYFVTICYEFKFGSGACSPEATLAVATGNKIVVAPPPATPGVLGWSVNLALASGQERKQNAAPMPLSSPWVQTKRLVASTGPQSIG